jgi:hypothetical protein
MAKPIEPTPPLEGEDAERFLRRLAETNKELTSEQIRKAKQRAFSIEFNVKE